MRKKQWKSNYVISIGDLKPENLLFTNNDDDAILKLTDFGFAKEGMVERKELRLILLSSFFYYIGNNEQRPLNTPW